MMNNRLLNTLANAIDNKEEIKKRTENGAQAMQELLSCVQNCQNRFGGKSELATEDDIRILQLCEKWEKVLSHGIKANLSSSTIQNLVTAGLNFTFSIVNVGNSLWSYCCLHMTKHEKERFKILSNINTPVGYFRAFLRASLNERSLERYLHSWISHGLLKEYYDEGALIRDAEASNLLPNMAAGLSSVLFALSIDRAELNETQQANQLSRPELVIPLPTPVKPAGPSRRKPLRQVISFDKNEQSSGEMKEKLASLGAGQEEAWRSAPATCLSSPDPAAPPGGGGGSEPTSSDVRSGIRHFFPDSVSSAQILTKLSERAKEMFSSSHSIDAGASQRDDRSASNLRISESDSEEAAASIDGSTSCLELCFDDDADPRALHSALEIREKEYLALQMKCNEIELGSKDKISRLEKVVLDLSKENERLKEQLRQYMSAVEMGRALKTGDSDTEVNEYEKKLVQVAEMHAELMEFNQHLQRRLQEAEAAAAAGAGELQTDCNVKAYIPAAFLVGKKTRTYHVYQIFLKIGAEEWNVYHRYAKFHELHTQLKKSHPDIASYKFPPKKTLGKRDAHLVEQRRLALQAYLRHVLCARADLRAAASRAQLITMLPFFGTSSTARENGTFNTTVARDQNMSSYAAL
ncbi:unnamed protein product [Plutella xylostella]|uniref:(diamondback moth) hypothetical protein n=1 Tax=Plutella xylostella TaxID=51655 RepID=A0A8S4DBB2_PLUXY|nr:unnamed protein product [Plutella xylostella]